jgi:RNA polymerase I-specific transcription initiation factor RRN3
MWSEIVDRMLRIDVEITRAGEDEDDDDDEEERLLALMSTSDIHGDPFDLRLDQDIPLDPIVREESDGLDDDDQDIDDLSSVDGSVSDAEEEVDEIKEAIARARKKLAILLNRRKLDGMMHYFIRHLGEAMGARAASPPAAQMAATTLASVPGSGESTPTSEFPSTPTSAQPQPLASHPVRTLRSPAEGLAAFQTLLNLFSRQILQTNATQHIPFLLFVASSYSATHVDLFLGLLVSLSLYGSAAAHSTHLTTGTVASQNQRIAATVYIGGIVCRARFVTDDQARHVLKYLLAYIDGKLSQAKQQRPDELPLFYAVCQAVMMIFCFRWRALARDAEDGVVGELEMEGDGLDEGGAGEGGKWMAELEVLQRVITSDLNPLLVSYLSGRLVKRWSMHNGSKFVHGGVRARDV